MFAWMRGQIAIRGTAGLLVCVACPMGCHRPIAPEGPSSESIAADGLEDIWDAALKVLQKHDFLPVRQDRAAGIIATLPTTSQHFSEFWRQDVAEPYGFAHASLHTTQRKATVRFVREGDTDAWSLEVQVDVYRLSTPESQVTSSSSAIQGFSGVLPTTEGEIARNRRWVHLGRDEMMERRILNRILDRV